MKQPRESLHLSPKMDETVSAADWTRIYSLSATLDGEGNPSASGRDAAASAAAAAEVAGAKEWASLMTGCSHDHAAERRVFEMPRSAQLACCAVYRRTGNLYFSEGAYDRALERYQRALTYYEYAFADDAGQQLALHRVRLSCLLNSASCHLRLRRPDDAISMLTQALSLLDEAEDDVRQAQRCAFKDASGALQSTIASSVSPADSAAARALTAEQAFCRRSRVKALLRRAVAHFHQQDFDAARGECDAAEAALRAIAAGSGASREAGAAAAAAATSAAGSEGEISGIAVPEGIGSSAAAPVEVVPAAETAAAAGSSLFSLDADDIDADVSAGAASFAESAASSDVRTSAPAEGGGSAAPVAGEDDVMSSFCRSAAREIAAMRAAVTEAVAEHEAELRSVATAMFKSR